MKKKGKSSRATILAGLGMAVLAATHATPAKAQQDNIVYTLEGDANLDGKVNGADFLLMETNFNDSITAAWDQGDFNYSGTVNGDDFVLLAEDFGQFASQTEVSDADQAALDSFAAANGITLDDSTSVPEPVSVGLLGAASLGMMARRRRPASI